MSSSFTLSLSFRTSIFLLFSPVVHPLVDLSARPSISWATSASHRHPKFFSVSDALSRSARLNMRSNFDFIIFSSSEPFFRLLLPLFFSLNFSSFLFLSVFSSSFSFSFSSRAGQFWLRSNSYFARSLSWSLLILIHVFHLLLDKCSESPSRYESLKSTLQKNYGAADKGEGRPLLADESGGFEGASDNVRS